jgi:hypothetical protein
MVTQTTSLQGALVLACRPGCGAMGMRAAGQGCVARMQRSDTQREAVAESSWVGFGALTRVDLGREFVPHAEILSFASPKESIQRKGDPKVAPLRVTLRFSKAAAAAELAPALRPGTQTVLADFPAAFCDARRDLREPVRGGASSLGLGKEWFSVGCNQRASALHRMAYLSKTSGVMRCASIAPCLGFCRSDFSPTAALTKHRVGLKSDLQPLRWRSVGNVLPTQSGGPPAAHPTQASQAQVIAYQWIRPVGSTRSAALGYLSWRDKKGTVLAGHPRHPITRVSAQNTMARHA